ncbi:polysaccharide biosynthesis tyrosine autokinase [Pleurocapsales cyanobacterium LEGE 06147]|nr:polysaccharide biosynthesis tyrosine autokinase [Pleurocapsales cyanobacterium LEGE 06147]
MLNFNSNNHNSTYPNYPNYPNSTAEQSMEFREAIDVNLSGYLLKLKRRWKPALAIFLLTVTATAIGSMFLKKNYAAEGKLLFKQDRLPSLVGLDKEVGELKPLLNNQSPLSTQVEVITSGPVLQETIEELQLKNEEGELLKPDDLRQRLNIKLIGGSDVVEISYRNPDPKVAANVVNTLMDVYIQRQIRNIQAEPATAKEFINKQLPQVEAKVAQAESKLREFKETNNVVNLTKEAETTVVELAALNRQMIDVGAELQGVEAQSAAMRSQLGLNLDQAISANQLGSSPVIQAILTELGNVESQLANERQRFRDNHPSVISLRDKQTSLNEQLQQQVAQKVGQGVEIAEGLLKTDNLKENQLEKYINLEIDRLKLQRQLASLSESQQNALVRAKQLPELEKQEQVLLRQVQAARSTYETLLGSLQEVQLAENQQSGNAQIIETALIPEEGSSGRLAVMALGILLGLFLSNLSVMLLEMQDRSLKTVAEIKQKFPYPILGIIPKEEEHAAGVIVEKQPDSFVSELYRMIQANLKFLGLQQPLKVILLTSSVPEEGKSTVSANLAAAVAQLGRRVLLIDGDLRNPSQHRLWNCNNQIGLKDVLTVQKPLDSVLFKPLEHLDMLTAGQVPSNPLALLDSDKMNDLVARARQEYDLIVIDAPPLPITADVLTLSTMVDGILFVSRPGVVDEESAARAKETLAITGKPILGMVVNGVKAKEFERYSYYAKYAKRYLSRRSSNPENNGTAKEAGMQKLNRIL